MVKNEKFLGEVKQMFQDEMSRADIHMESARQQEARGGTPNKDIMAHLKRARKHLKVAMMVLKFKGDD